ncbi:hypothetical protein [Macrococcus lamae]|uniref:DUF3800 domain-containing protein n=1 Tax=Macrococcus lamae TaxID=198484 RepID=A0A4R6BS31_9STAP|nr:hypothetical protein [Macrococcus lamae]TDM05177.1 hypothetical protein ERX29_10600 [Macrococcus lamae]
MTRDETMFYTYIDECKTNYFVTEFYKNNRNNEIYNFYSLSSVSFKSEEYLHRFEERWCQFKEKFNIPSNTCLHFAEYKKLLSSNHVKNIELAIKQKLEIFHDNNHVDIARLENILNNSPSSFTKDLEKIKTSDKEIYQEYKKLFNRYTKKTLGIDEKDITAYNLFLDSSSEFNIRIVHNFFLEMKKVLKESNFSILNTDYINKKKSYLPIRKNTEKPELTSLTHRPAKNLSKDEPRITMKKHLDILIEFLISREFEGNIYLDENLPKTTYSKLRFDADGKEFEAKNDLKTAFHECLTTGTERFVQETAVALLDEIRFIRKEEVGSGNNPPHCGSEVVDFLCSLVCTGTRIDYLHKNSVISKEDFPKAKYTTLSFEQNLSDISFQDIIEDKLFLATTIDYS